MAYKTKLTAIGRAKIAAALAQGTTLEITEMAIGDGRGNPVGEPKGTETGLKREVLRRPLNRLERATQIDEFVIAEMIVPADIGGWTLREVGLYDVDDDIIAYGNFPDIYKGTLTDGAPQEIAVQITIVVTSEVELTLVIDPNIVTATRSWVRNAIDAKGHLPPGGNTAQILTKVSNDDYDAEWRDQSDVNLIVNTIEEVQELAANQTVVNLATVNTTGTAYYIEGERLVPTYEVNGTVFPEDYVTDSSSQITLSRAYAAGSKFHAVQNEPNAELRAANVPVDALANIPGATTVQNALEQLGLLNPAGMVQMFATPNAPTGWLVANGAAVSRTTYARLFNAIGERFGGGDGSTTFNLPNTENLFVRGASALRPVGMSENDQIGRHGHDAASASSGEHIHSGSTSSSGVHNHSGTTASGGSHAHSGSANAGGSHSHSGRTSSNGEHTHRVYQGRSGSHTATDSREVRSGDAYYSTSAAGNHNHSLSVNSAGSHTHTLSINTSGNHTHTFSTANAGGHAHDVTVNKSGIHSHNITVSETGGDETRPVNIAFLYCIKY